MWPGRTRFIVTALMLGAMAVPAHAATIQVVMENLVVSPAEVSAKVGDTVEWINKDVFAHTATARNGDFDVTMPPKKTVTLGSEESRHGRILLPLSSQHEGGADDRAVADRTIAVAIEVTRGAPTTAQIKAAPTRGLTRQWPFCCQVDQPRTGYAARRTSFNATLSFAFRFLTR